MDGLSASALADLAGTTAAEVRRLLDLGILVARDGTGPFRAGDAQKVRLVAACERAGLPMVDRAFMACYRRQQELVWTEDLVEDIEDGLERAGSVTRLERVPVMCFLDLAGYTRLTEERGDAAAGPRRDAGRAGRGGRLASAAGSR